MFNCADIRDVHVCVVIYSSDRERWMTALDDEASRKGRAVEAIYEDAEMTHYEVVADHMAIEPDELSLTLGTTVVVRRKTPDGKNCQSALCYWCCLIAVSLCLPFSVMMFIQTMMWEAESSLTNKL